MSARTYPAGIRRLLTALERRLLSLLLLFGCGQILLMSSGVLVALYGLDRMFRPPAWFRLALLAIAVFYVLRVALRSLLGPLRARPSAQDLAALLERHHPGLQDLLATAVESETIHQGESAQLKHRVVGQAEKAIRELPWRSAAPAGTAQRSALRGLLCLAGLVTMALLEPTEARIFFARMIGVSVAWPQDTTLVLLPPYASGNGESLPFSQTSPGNFQLQAARGTTLTLRIRAEGEVPDQVTATGPRGRRVMQALGGGEFVLRLPALDQAAEWHFEGGDDRDGTPHLLLIPGIPPAIQSWAVHTTPPDYTGLAAQDSDGHEFRVPQGTRFDVSFQSDMPVSEAQLRFLDGQMQEIPQTDGGWTFQIQAEQSGECVVELLGTDGFFNRQAAVLRWRAEPDHKPKIQFLFPDRRWISVPGADLPLLIQASDDYGLAQIELQLDPESWPLATQAGQKEFLQFELRKAPLPSAEDFGADFRMRFIALAQDGSLPLAQNGKSYSPWIRVLSPASFEEELSQRMVRIRQRLEDQIDNLKPILESQAGNRAATVARRIDRELEGILRDLEYALIERIYTGIDRGSAPLQTRLNEFLLTGAPATGDVVHTLSAAGTPPALDRSALLLDLARAAQSTRSGPSQALRLALLEQVPELPAAKELDVELHSMLDALLAWEDFQSAVDLLRGLLDRQRSLYLRTQEASGR
jgi:hypothetical protein